MVRLESFVADSLEFLEDGARFVLEREDMMEIRPLDNPGSKVTVPLPPHVYLRVASSPDKSAPILLVISPRQEEEEERLDHEGNPKPRSRPYKPDSIALIGTNGARLAAGTEPGWIYDQAVIGHSGKIIALGPEPHLLRLSTLTTNGVTVRELKHDADVKLAGFDRIHDRLVSEAGGSLYIWELLSAASRPRYRVALTNNFSLSGISPDGSVAVLSDKSSLALLWLDHNNLERNEGFKVLENSSFIQPPEFSRSGPFITGHGSRSAWVWEYFFGSVLTRGPAAHLAQLERAIYSTGLDSEFGAPVLITTAVDDRIRIWQFEDRFAKNYNSEANYLRETLYAGELANQHVAVSPDGSQILYVVPGTATLRSWDLRQRDEPLRVARGGKIRPLSGEASFSPDGRWIAIGGEPALKATDGDAVGNIALPGLERSQAPHFSPDGQRVVARAEEGDLVHLWSLADAAHPKELRLSTPPVAAYFTPDSKKVVVLGEQTIVLADLSGAQITNASIPKGLQLQLSHSTQQCFRDPSARKAWVIWKPSTPTSFERYELDSEIRACTVSQDDSSIAILDDNSLLRIFDAATGRVMNSQRVDAPKNESVTLRFSPSGNYLHLSAGAWSSLISLCGQKIPSGAGRVRAISPDDAWGVRASDGVTLYDMTGRRPPLQLSKNVWGEESFSPGSDRLLVHDPIRANDTWLFRFRWSDMIDLIQKRAGQTNALLTMQKSRPSE